MQEGHSFDRMISFVVPAHNEQAWLGRCLSAIDEATRGFTIPCEKIVVDDSSTDATASMGVEHGARVISVAHRQISASRNSGARAASGDVLFFVDADTLITDQVVASALSAIDHGAAGGGCIPQFEGRIPFWFRMMYPILVFTMRRVINQTGGACLFCTRAAFNATGGFSEKHYAAEEDIWVKSLKRQGRFVVLPEPVITSGRSLRTQSFRTIAKVFLRLALRGADGFRTRDAAELWYQPHREEPATNTSRSISPEN